MVPQTLSAALAFLMLVAPGLVHEQLRGRRKLIAGESVFREISRIALTSLLYSVMAVTILLVLRFWFPHQLIDSRLLVQFGAVYLRDNYRVVAATLAAELAVACLLPLLWHIAPRPSARSRVSFAATSLWFEDFRANCPPGSRPWVHVQLTDGTSFYGFVRSSSVDGPVADRELSLEGVHMAREDPDTDDDSYEDEPVVIGDEWESVIIRGSEIRYIAVQYIDRHAGTRTNSSRYRDALDDADDEPDAIAGEPAPVP
ncbi:DUF6338 family protein [Lentzea sp. NPDC005914]|uniref:DUF6338 family protein n=1 Tax=Lentzea sp. NPDC005914 TaxID=3154572 RepID=UPI0033FF149F